MVFCLFGWGFGLVCKSKLIYFKSTQKMKGASVIIFCFSMYLTPLIFLCTIGCITHKNQGLETQDRRCITVTSPEKSIPASEKGHCFLRWGKMRKASGGLIKQQKAFKEQNHSQSKMKYTQPSYHVGLGEDTVVVKN